MRQGIRCKKKEMIMKNLKLLSRLVTITLSIVICVSGCPDLGNVSDNTGDMNLSFDLSYAKSLSSPLTKLTITLTPGSGAAPIIQDLTIDQANSIASGRIPNLTVGPWTLDIALFSNQTIIAHGSSSVEVKPGQTATATIVLTFEVGDVQVDVDWSYPGATPLISTETFDVIYIFDQEVYSGYIYSWKNVRGVSYGSYQALMGAANVFPDGVTATLSARSLKDQSFSLWASDSEVSIYRNFPQNYLPSDIMGTYRLALTDSNGCVVTNTDTIDSTIAASPIITSPLDQGIYLASDTLSVNWTLASESGISCIAVLISKPGSAGLSYAHVVIPSTRSVLLPPNTLTSSNYSYRLIIVAFDKPIAEGDLISMLSSYWVYGGYSVRDGLLAAQSELDYDFITACYTYFWVY
jgi:hypothetical protein